MIPPQNIKEYNQFKKKILKLTFEKLPQKFTVGDFIENWERAEISLGISAVSPQTGNHFLHFNRFMRVLDDCPKEGKFYLK